MQTSGFLRVFINSAFVINAYSFSSDFKSLYNTIKIAATALAAIGIAGSAIQIITGDSQSAMKAKRRMIVIGMAVAAMYAIPLAVMAFKNLVPEWDPSSLK